MTRLHDIQTPHWQAALGADGVVTDAADIAQAIRIVLMTPLGSDPHRPAFGCDNFRYIDKPIARALPHLVRETRAALERWEKRAEFVALKAVIAGAELILRLTWRPVGGSDQVVEVPYARAA